MSWLSEFLHPSRAYEKAQVPLNESFDQAQGYVSPYEEAFRDPRKLQADWMESYEQSPQAKNAIQQAQGYGADAASSLGLMGSNTALNAIQQGSSNIGLADRDKYMDSMMQKYLAGAQLAQGLGQNAMNYGQNRAQLAYGQNTAQGNLFGNLLGAGAQGASQLAQIMALFKMIPALSKAGG